LTFPIDSNTHGGSGDLNKVPHEYEYEYGEEEDAQKGEDGDIIGDEDDEEFDYIDLNNLPNDQQQYFLEGNYNNEQSGPDQEEEDDGINPNVKFYENLEENLEEQEEQSDYCEDLIDLY
jgi:hypothetical protein